MLKVSILIISVLSFVTSCGSRDLTGAPSSTSARSINQAALFGLNKSVNGIQGFIGVGQSSVLIEINLNNNRVSLFKESAGSVVCAGSICTVDWFLRPVVEGVDLTLIEEIKNNLTIEIETSSTDFFVQESAPSGQVESVCDDTVGVLDVGEKIVVSLAQGEEVLSKTYIFTLGVSNNDGVVPLVPVDDVYEEARYYLDLDQYFNAPGTIFAHSAAGILVDEERFFVVDARTLDSSIAVRVCGSIE